jgi:hypothetical protein
VNGSQRVVQVAEGVSGVPEWQHGEGGEAQDTHENVSTRSKYLPYRVCSLCSSARHVRAEPQMDEARDHLTERCLQLNDYHHDRITQLGIHQQQPESQELLPVAALLFDPVVREGLASHSCAAGLSQGHPHIAHYHTTTYQQLPPPQRETLHHAAQPLDGLGLHTKLRVDDSSLIAFRELHRLCALKVEVCLRGWDAFRRGPNRAAPSNTIIPLHTCKLAAIPYEQLARHQDRYSCGHSKKPTMG